MAVKKKYIAVVGERPTFSVSMPKYVAQWARFHFGSPLKFMRGMPEYIVMLRYLSYNPSTQSERDMPDYINMDFERVEIALPYQEVKSTKQYKYITRGGRVKLMQIIYSLIDYELFVYMTNRRLEGETTQHEALEAWCRENGVSIDYVETLGRRFTRIRNRYMEHRLDLRLQRRNRN